MPQALGPKAAGKIRIGVAPADAQLGQGNSYVGLAASKCRDELRALRKLKREAPKSPFVFVSERGGPFTTDSFNWMVKRVAQRTGFPFQVHAHMLRHSAGFKLAGDGHDTRSIQDYLGHKNIQHTVRYTELSPTRFKEFWRD